MVQARSYLCSVPSVKMVPLWPIHRLGTDGNQYRLRGPCASPGLSQELDEWWGLYLPRRGWQPPQRWCWEWLREWMEVEPTRVSALTGHSCLLVTT